MITHAVSPKYTPDFLCVPGAKPEKLRRESLEERSLNERLSLTLLALGHDLRQDLHLLNATVNLASRRPEEGHERDDRTATLIMRLTRRCEQATAIATMARANPKTASKRPVPIQAVLLEAYQQWHPEAERKGLSFKLRSPNVMVATDPVWFRVIVSNLIANAIQQTLSGPWFDGRRKAKNDLGFGLQLVKQAAALLGHALRISSSPLGSIVRLSIARGTAPMALLPESPSIDVIGKNPMPDYAEDSGRAP